MKFRVLPLLFAVLLAGGLTAPAQPKGQPKAPPRAPDPGLEIPPTVRAGLGAKVQALGREIETLRTELKARPDMLELLPDVQIYFNAVHYALAHGIFYNTNEFRTAEAMVNFGHYRAKLLREGRPSWIQATGLVVRGYVSRIDGSVQPYGLEVPASYRPDAGRKHRLDLWFHGRDSKLSELKFINDRQTKYGQFQTPDVFVLQPYGRHNNGSRFAGETDAFEALAAVQKHYPIDEDRVSVRGFSLGGATTWHLATHHAGRWFAAAPGAGFSDTAQFLRIYSREPKPTWFEEKLWQMYDAVAVPGNLWQCPTIAYSGEKDGQKLAADLMEAAMAKEGLKLKHVIGKDMGHRYDTNSIQEINQWMNEQAGPGRDRTPRQIRFTLYTLAFNEMKWVTVDALEQHWTKATLNADVTGPGAVQVKTENIVAFTLNLPAGQKLVSGTPKVTVDGRELAGPAVGGDQAWRASFYKLNGQWQAGALPDYAQRRKRPGLQGPIDHAFMDSFLFVTPTGRPANPRFAAWLAAEQADAVAQWWLQMRGQARVKKDTEVTDEDIARNHLVLWGDAQSNKVLGRIMDQLPLQWNARELKVGSRTFSADTHAPVLIHPNPLNPQRYVVLNSGFTFSAAGIQNNAQQYPRLPDYAVLDMSVPRTQRHPGGVALAGFFDEQWKLVEPPQ